MGVRWHKLRPGGKAHGGGQLYRRAGVQHYIEQNGGKDKLLNKRNEITEKNMMLTHINIIHVNNNILWQK